MLVRKFLAHILQPCHDSVVVIAATTVPLAVIVNFAHPAIAIAPTGTDAARHTQAAAVADLRAAGPPSMVVELSVYGPFPLSH